MPTQTFSRSVRRVLNIEDKLRIGSEMADAAAKLESAEEELKEVKSQYNNRIAIAEALIGKCQRALNNGWQMADVTCYWLMDHPRYGAKTIIRTDTAEIVESEDMTDRDRQRLLDFEAANAAATVAVDPAENADATPAASATGDAQ